MLITWPVEYFIFENYIFGIKPSQVLKNGLFFIFKQMKTKKQASISSKDRVGDILYLKLP